MTTALLLVDIQEDFFDQVVEPQRDRLLSSLAKTILLFRRAGQPVVYAITEVTLDPDTRMPHWRQRDIRRCLAGQPGSRVPTDLAPLKEELVVVKPFFSAFSQLSLEGSLRGMGVERVVVAGLHTHACVYQTALEAYARRFQTLVAVEAVGSYDPLQAAVTLDYLAQRLVPSLGLSQLRAFLSGETARRSDVARVSEALFGLVGKCGWRGIGPTHLDSPWPLRRRAGLELPALFGPGDFSGR